MHLKESYQRTTLVITAFSEDDVIVTSGDTPLGPPVNGDPNGTPIGIGIGDTPPTWY